MKETSIVRQNLMDDKNYRPYCGSNIINDCYNPRTELRPDGQFICQIVNGFQNLTTTL